ncbi:hypothetical protein ACFY0F_00545 [Streptomyces sp. NPDC001544]|uniref:hypothetical protein n=1 Tax=Streptomyces sp. NPDC001544 TaxID=3364584 RepID=UPI0036C3557E
MSVNARYKMYVTPQTFVDLDRRSAVTAPEDAADSEFYVTVAGQSFQFADAQGGPGTALVEYGLIGLDDIPNCAALTPTSSYVSLDALEGGTGLCVHTSDHRWVLVQPSTTDPSTGDGFTLDVSYLASS